jgi:hypothetical protein
MNLRLAATIAVITAGCAAASPVGTLGLGSSGFVEATLTSILFTPDSAGQPAGPWNADVNAATDLTFANGPLLQQEGVLINGGFAFGTPPDGTLSNPFLQFALHPDLLYTLNTVFAGVSTNCVNLAIGASCSISVDGNVSPVVLQRTSTGTQVGINFGGTATDGQGTSNWVGGFSATIQNMTPRDIELYFCPDGSCSASDITGKTLKVTSVSGSFDATTTSAIPEPGTLSLLLGGAGLMVVGLVRRKRQGSAETF